VATLALDPLDPEVRAFERARAEQLRARRRSTLVFVGLMALALGLSIEIGEVSVAGLVRGLPEIGSYIYATLPEIALRTAAADLAEWYWNVTVWLRLLFDTLVIAFLATLLGGVVGLVLAFFAAANLGVSPWLRFLVRRLLEIMRSVPELVYALIFVFAFGIGALPGVLAIAVHAAGALGKLYTEVNENADLRPADGVVAAGGDWPTMLRWAIVPQVLPLYLSYTLLRFEINVRSAAIIGFVGAGGIGQELYFVIRQFIYTDVSAIVLMILVTVSLIDIGCERLRHRIIGEDAFR
jgi:phosphonate transport system permease protein